MSKTIKLTSPIKSHRGDLSEITLNPVKVSSFIRHGDPVELVTKDGNVVATFPNQKATLGFLADSTGLDELTLECLSSTDYLVIRMELAYMLYGFTGATKSPLDQSAA